MTTIHKIICDRCGKEGKLTTSSYTYGYMNTPDKWTQSKKDLCPKCSKEFDKYKAKFE